MTVERTTEESLEYICDVLSEIRTSLDRLKTDTHHNGDAESLDDKFAMAAMAALIARSDGDYDVDRIAHSAYSFAEAMVGEKQRYEKFP